MRIFRSARWLLLALVLLMVAIGIVNQIATNGQVQVQILVLFLLLALLWFIYIHLPNFIQKALRSLWTSRKKDKH